MKTQMQTHQNKCPMAQGEMCWADKENACFQVQEWHGIFTHCHTAERRYGNSCQQKQIDDRCDGSVGVVFPFEKGCIPPSVQKLMYVMSGKSAFTSVSIGANLSVSGDTVTVKATTAIFKGSKWKLVFSDGSNTLEVPFELK